MSGNCRSFSLVHSNGDFDVCGLHNFVCDTELTQQEVSYVVTSIMGPQGSGKSTLLNHLFGTNFEMRDPRLVGEQTTKGIWMARSSMEEKMIIVLDVEGTDGRERGDDENFGRQSSYYALAVSDIIILNMWCHDFGRQNAGSRPLLKTIFQVMIEKLPTNGCREKILMFVVRDKKLQWSIKDIESSIRNDLDEIWDSAKVPRAQESVSFDSIFRLKVVALSNYETDKARFREEVHDLRQRFSADVRGIRAALPATEFPGYLENTWEDVKHNRDLNLPSYVGLVAESHCTRIRKEVYSSFVGDQTWVGNRPADAYGEYLISILQRYLGIYDENTRHYVEDVRLPVRNILHGKIAEELLKAMLKIPVMDCFYMNENVEETWGKIRELRQQAIETFAGIDEGQRMLMEGVATDVVITVARDEAQPVKLLRRMRDRFNELFDDSAEDIDASVGGAHEAALQLLYVLAATRLGENSTTEHGVDPLDLELLSGDESIELLLNFEGPIPDRVSRAKANQVSVAENQCRGILEEVYNSFVADETWVVQLGNRMENRPADAYGEDLRSILQRYLAMYDARTIPCCREDIRLRSRDKLHEDIVKALLEAILETAVKNYFCEGTAETWARISQLHRQAIQMLGFDEQHETVIRIEDFATAIVQRVVRGEAQPQRVLQRMINRFNESFETSAEDIDASAHTAREAAFQVLDVAAAIVLDDGSSATYGFNPLQIIPLLSVVIFSEDLLTADQCLSLRTDFENAISSTINRAKERQMQMPMWQKMRMQMEKMQMPMYLLYAVAAVLASGGVGFGAGKLASLALAKAYPNLASKLGRLGFNLLANVAVTAFLIHEKQQRMTEKWE